MSDAWFKFYPSDWLSGTRAFTLAETGLYVTLIAMMYEAGQPIDMDRKRLARMCGTTPKAFEKALSALIDAGKIVMNDGGLWSNRVQKEQEKRQYIAKKASQSAAIRWRKGQQNQCPSDANASKAHMRSECLPESQKPETRLDTNVSKVRKRAYRLPEDWQIPEEWVDEAVSRGLARQRAYAEADRMRNWSQSSPKGAKVNWRAAWRNWISDKADQPAKPADRHQSATDVRRNAWREAIADEDVRRASYTQIQPASPASFEVLHAISGSGSIASQSEANSSADRGADDPLLDEGFGPRFSEGLR